MRIISNFHDYYDSAAATGHDAAIIYARKTQEVLLPSNFFETDFWGTVMPAALGFCGKVYPLWLVAQEHYREKKVPLDYSIHYDCNFDYPKNWYSRSWKKFAEKDFSPLKKYFFEHRVPIWVTYNTFIEKLGRKQMLILNPRLLDYSFQKQLSAYETFQEIEMFLSNDLTGERKPPVMIDDRYRIEAHGFDKWSFRKHKEQNK